MRIPESASAHRSVDTTATARAVACERSATMQHPESFDIDYREHQRQVAWINEHDWQFERPVKRYPVRQGVAKVLIALADALTPPAKPETQPVP
jgi:hypothetical protein